MKKLFFPFTLLLIASTIFIACGSDPIYEPEPDPPPPPPPPTEYIVVADEETLNQTVYADEETASSTIEFTTRAPWQSSIAAVATSLSTRDVATSWASVYPTSGGIGDYEIEITLEPNKTGADRTVKISITSGGTTITIRITQQAVRECGTTHLPVYSFSFTVFEANEAWEEGAAGRFLSENATVTLYRLVNGEFEWIDELLTNAYGVATRTSSYTDLFYTVTKEEKGQLFDGFLVAGIFTSWDEVERVQYPETALIANPRPGSVKVVDIHGTGVITYADRQESPHRSISVTNTADTETVITTEATIISPDFRVRVEGVDINGIRWATRNVDMPGTFAENPEDAGMFFQWNRRVGWSSTDPMVNSDGGTTWDSSVPEGTMWYRENDPCPDGWRVPTRTELQLLLDAGSVWTTQNGINGRLFGSEPNQIFLPAAGTRSNTFLDNNMISYWSSTGSPGGSVQGLEAWGQGQLNIVGHLSRSRGNSIRCVEDIIIPVESVTLNQSAITLGETATLIATVLPANATFGHLTWRSSDGAVAGVDATGVVRAVSFSGGTATITATTECGTHTATATVTVEGNVFSGISNSLDGVVIDGIRWATRNVDMPGTFAQNPQDAGMIYQFGSLVGWSSTDPMINSDGGTTWNASFNSSWRPERDPCPDGWRVPTEVELRSLVNSGSVAGTLHGIGGRLFGTAPNQIFLPAAGRRWCGMADFGTLCSSVGRTGFYWSRQSQPMYFLSFGKSSGGVSRADHVRTHGMSVRCIAGVAVESIWLCRSAVTLGPGEYVEIFIARINPYDAGYGHITWTSNNNAVAAVDADGVVTAVSRGMATITAATGCGATAAVIVTVE